MNADQETHISPHEDVIASSEHALRVLWVACLMCVVAFLIIGNVLITKHPSPPLSTLTRTIVWVLVCFQGLLVLFFRRRFLARVVAPTELLRRRFPNAPEAFYVVRRNLLDEIFFRFAFSAGVAVCGLVLALSGGTHWDLWASCVLAFILLMIRIPTRSRGRNWLTRGLTPAEVRSLAAGVDIQTRPMKKLVDINLVYAGLVFLSVPPLIGAGFWLNKPVVVVAYASVLLVAHGLFWIYSHLFASRRPSRRTAFNNYFFMLYCVIVIVIELI